MSECRATGGRKPAVKSVKHAEKHFCTKQRLNRWLEARFILLSQNQRIAHLLSPQTFISAEPKGIDILGVELPFSASVAFL